MSSKKKNLLYKQVAERLITLIDQGVLRNGEKIPSIRNLSDTLGVSLNTIKEAYLHLENQYYIEAVPQSGFYVRENLTKTENAKYTDPLKLDLEEISLCRIYGAFQEQGRVPPGLELSISHLDSELFLASKLEKYLIEAIKYKPRQSYNYLISPGDSSLREQISKHYVVNGIQIRSDELIITNGCLEAIYLSLMTICQPGDTVAIETPSYFSFVRTLEFLGLKVLEIPCSFEKGMSISALQFALENHSIKAVLSVANFNNPLGSLIPDENKQEIVSLLNRFNVPLIEDDIHGDLFFTESKPKPFISYDQTGNTVLCSSFSKTIAPGIRIGWIAPGKYYSRVEEAKSMLNVGTASLFQIAIAEFLKSGTYNRSLRQLRKTLKDQIQNMRKLILAHFPKGTKVNDPRGGFLLWVELPKNYDCLKLFSEALKQDIGIAPGALFSMQGKYSNFMRLNAGITNNLTEFLIKKLAEIIKKNC